MVTVDDGGGDNDNHDDYCNGSHGGGNDGDEGHDSKGDLKCHYMKH